MKTRFVAGLIILLAVILINACENKQGAIPLTPIVGSCDTTRLTYSSDSNTMQAIINIQCGVTNGNTSCHGTNSTGANDGYDFTTYSGIFAQYQNSNLYGALFGSLPRMPLTAQSGWDPSCMLPKFTAWMDRKCPQ